MKDDSGTKIVPLPGGLKLLSNTENTGQVFIDDYRLAQKIGESMSREDLMTLLEGHAKIGEAMVDAVGRTRKAMEKES